MSNIGHRRRARAMHSIRSRRSIASNPITVDLELTSGGLPSCIDLTCEADIDENEAVIVDLTSPNDNGVVCLGTGVEDYRPISSRTRRRSRSPHQAIEVLEDSTASDDVELPPYLGSAPLPRKSLEGSIISCPVCLDVDQEIRRSGRQLMSTVCGHVFCNICITESVKSTRKCPKCRRRLTAKQVHPLFI